MSFDLNILAVSQTEPSRFSNISSIEIIDEKKEQLRYFDIWRFMTRTEGIWYNIGINQDGIFSALPLLDAEFDIDEKVVPYWVDDNDDIKSDLVPLLLKQKFKQDFKRVVKTLIHESPNGTVYLMARMQGGDNEIVCGVLSFEDFWDLHDRKKILFNVCYIINNESY